MVQTYTNRCGGHYQLQDNGYVQVREGHPELGELRIRVDGNSVILWLHHLDHTALCCC